eukprot:1822980-Alexandrium_andersonii.AAC.1
MFAFSAKGALGGLDHRRSPGQLCLLALQSADGPSNLHEVGRCVSVLLLGCGLWIGNWPGERGGVCGPA